MLSRRSILFIVVILAIVGGAFLFWSSRPKNLKLEVAPSVANIVLDGQKNLHPGEWELTPGNHTIAVSMNGFASHTQQFTVTDGKLTTVIIVLIPNSPAGYAYLKAHPDQQRLSEELGAEQFKMNNRQVAGANPLVKKLPYIASDNSYRIDYGAINGTKVHIYITAISEQAVQQAKDWITSQGYNVNQLLLSSSIEPLLDHVPYQTTDYDIQPDFGSGPNGEPVLHLHITLKLSAADSGDAQAAAAQYKQEALDYIASWQVDPANYQITYSIQQG